MKHLLGRNQSSHEHFTRIEHASVAIGKDGNPMEVSIAESDAEYDDDTLKPSAVDTCDEGLQLTSTYQRQMQQLFMTLQDERRLHQKELNALTSEIALLKKEKDLSRTEQHSLSLQLQQQQSSTINELTPKETVINDTTNGTATNDIPSTSPNDTINSTLEAVLENYAKLDEDSRKVLIHHAITTNNTALQKHILQLKTIQGNKISLAKLTKEIIKLADTYKVQGVAL